MSRYLSRTLAAVAVLALPGALAAQEQQHAFFIGVYGGGASQLTKLSASGAPSVDFKPGWSLGGTAGFDISKYFGLHGDFTYTNAQARGATTFAGVTFRRFYYGAHLEARYPLTTGFTPYLFAGGGAVTINQTSGTEVGVFTKPAMMYGLGFSYQLPHSPLGLFIEGKNMVYKWDQGGFNRTMVDLAYVGGLSYRFPV